MERAGTAVPPVGRCGRSIRGRSCNGHERLRGADPRVTLNTVPDEPTWDQRILRLIDAGIDVTQIDRNLKLTPTERLEQMEAMLRDLEEMRGTPRAARSAPR